VRQLTVSAIARIRLSVLRAFLDEKAAFCGHCGSPLYTHAADDRSTYGLRLGCIEQRRLLTPVKQVWCRSALPWSMNIEALPRYEKQGQRG